MDDTVIVSGREAIKNLDDDPHDLGKPQRGVSAEPLAEGAAVNVLHHQKGQAAVDADTVDGDHVGVADGGGSAGFSEEPAAGAGAG